MVKSNCDVAIVIELVCVFERVSGMKLVINQRKQQAWLVSRTKGGQDEIDIEPLSSKTSIYPAFDLS